MSETRTTEPTTKAERWRKTAIPNYWASNLGRIKHKERLKAIYIGAHGYPSVSLWDGAKCRTHKVHALVLSAFRGPRPTGFVARHMDGIKTNNNITNLRWGTHKQNREDRFIHGTGCEGEKSSCSKFTDIEVLAIRTSSLSGGELARIMGVSRTAINSARSGVRYRHLNELVAPVGKRKEG